MLILKYILFLILTNQQNEEYYPVSMVAVIKSLSGETQFPMKMNRDFDEIYIDFRTVSEADKIELHMDQMNCENFEHFQVLVSDSTKKETFRAAHGGSLNCKDYMSNGIITVHTHIVTRFVLIDLFFRNCEKKHNPHLPFVSINLNNVFFYAKKRLYKQIKDVSIKESSVDQYKYYGFATYAKKQIARVTLTMSSDFDFSDKNKFPVEEVSLKYADDISPTYVVTTPQYSVSKKVFVIAFPSALKTKMIRVKNWEKVSRIDFDEEVDYPEIGSSNDFSKKIWRSRDNIPMKVYRVEMKNYEEGKELIGYLDIKTDGKKKTIYVRSKTNKIDVNIMAEEIRFAGGSPENDYDLTVYGDPCLSLNCENGGECVANNKFEQGYGCKCSYGFHGDLCEKSN